MDRAALIACLLVALVAAGCGGSMAPPGCVRPTAAVMKCDARAAFPMRRDLGGGLRDILVDRLMATERYHVVERPDLNSALGELKLQHSGATVLCSKV